MPTGYRMEWDTLEEETRVVRNMGEGDEVWDGLEGWVNVDGWCIVVIGGRVETWEIAREGLDGWGRGGVLGGSVVVGGRQGMDGTWWGGMQGKGHVFQGIHLEYMVEKGIWWRYSNTDVPIYSDLHTYSWPRILVHKKYNYTNLSHQN